MTGAPQAEASPATIAASAKLKAGQKASAMKSTTPPWRNRSDRLLAAPGCGCEADGGSTLELRPGSGSFRELIERHDVRNHRDQLDLSYHCATIVVPPSGRAENLGAGHQVRTRQYSLPARAQSLRSPAGIAERSARRCEGISGPAMSAVRPWYRFGSDSCARVVRIDREPGDGDAGTAGERI